MSTERTIDRTKAINSPINSIGEARRQVEVCNACRYCEGYCSVFPAIHRGRIFSDGDITQFANLCHNCRGCYYACQYAEPHEFKINIPRILAEVRTESWERYIVPGVFARTFQMYGVALGVMLIVGFALIFTAVHLLASSGAEGFYAYLPHTIMVMIFTPAFVCPLLVIAWGLRRYWRAVQGKRIKWQHFRSAIGSASELKNLSGGQGQGCNFEQGDRFTNRRRYYHQATMWGFLLCFASTATGTIMHYFLNWPAPYSLLSLPKLLGIPGGILLTAGCGGLICLKLNADRLLGARRVWGGEMAFVLLLGLTGLTGLLLYAASGSAMVQPLLAIHLGSVLAFFVTMPYSKMVHGFFRMAALVRDAQQRDETG